MNFAMHAYLISGGSKNQVNNVVDKLANDLKAKPIEFTVGKIDDVRSLKDLVKVTLHQKTVIIIKDIEEASLEASNAFLKLLEEPQEQLHFILTTSNLYRVIATIRSRTQIIKLPQGELQDNPQTSSDFLNFSVGEMFKITDKIKSRPEAEEFLKELLFQNHKRLESSENLLKNAEILSIIDATLSAILTNGNIQLQLTNMVVNINNK